MNLFEDQTIVIPFDFSDLAKQAVEYVLQFSDDSSPLHVVHVVEPMLLISLDSSVPVPPNQDSEFQTHASERMNEVFGDAKYQRLVLHCEVGDPGSEIVNLGNSLSAGMIVIPSHGRRGISRLLLGSVAERVLRLASCPVLILRGDRFDKPN